MSEIKQKILSLIIWKLVQAVQPPFIYEDVLVTVCCQGRNFTAKYKDVLQPGYTAKPVPFAEPEKDKDVPLPKDLEQGMVIPVVRTEKKQGFTSPPKVYTLYNKDFTERDGGILETDGDKSVQEAMTELLAEFGCDAAQGRIMDAAELREQADTVAEQQTGVLKEKLAAERPAPEETLSFYVAECLEFTFAGEFYDHLTMEEALEVYDKIPSERMNADKCIGFCIEENGGFVGMYELVVNDKVQRENINSINYFRDDKLVQQAISDMEKLMAARQQSKEQERGSTKKSVLDALRSLKAKKQEQPAQEQDKPKKAKKKGMEL